MLTRTALYLSLYLLFTAFSHFASAEESNYQILYKKKPIGTLSIELQELDDGRFKHIEKAHIKIKKFLMRFSIDTESIIVFDKTSIDTFNAYETVNGDKSIISGKRSGSNIEVFIQEHDEEPESYTIDSRSYELSGLTPPLLQHQLFSSKNIGDEIKYLDINTLTEQGIKITDLSKNGNRLTVSYRFIGDKEFIRENKGITTITMDSMGKIYDFIDGDGIRFVLQ